MSDPKPGCSNCKFHWWGGKNPVCNKCDYYTEWELQCEHKIEYLEARIVELELELARAKAGEE